MKNCGGALGVAFQIQDDLLDLIGEEDVVGKSLGLDLTKGKITLPIICHLKIVTQARRGEALRLIASNRADELRDQLHQSGAVRRASEIASGLIEDAKGQLAHLPAGEPRDLLMTLADAVIARSR